MAIREVIAAQIFEQGRWLMEMHYNEAGFYFEFNPSLELYQTMEQAGLLHCLAAFDGDEMIGYCSFFMSRHLFNRDLVAASSDALYVHPDYRNRPIAGKLIAKSEQYAKEHGANVFVWHTRAGTALSNVLLKRPEYEAWDMCIARRL